MDTHHKFSQCTSYKRLLNPDLIGKSYPPVPKTPEVDICCYGPSIGKLLDLFTIFSLTLEEGCQGNFLQRASVHGWVLHVWAIVIVHQFVSHVGPVLKEYPWSMYFSRQGILTKRQSVTCSSYILTRPAVLRFESSVRFCYGAIFDIKANIIIRPDSFLGEAQFCGAVK